MLVDSTALIDLIRNYPPATTAFETKLNNQNISIASKLEIIVGFNRKSLVRNFEKLLNKFNMKTLPINEEVSAVAEQIISAYFHSHGIGILDSLIVATALVYGEELITSNIKHFNFIPNLKLLKPY